MAARHLLQSVTKWATSEAHFGGFTYATPEALQARWEERAELYRAPSGEELVSKAVVYLSDDVDPGDYIALGDQTAVADPTTLSSAFRVMQFSKVSDLRNIQVVRKAFL